MNPFTLLEQFNSFHKNNHEVFDININDYHRFINDAWTILSQTDIRIIEGHEQRRLLWAFYGLGEILHESSNWNNQNKNNFRQTLSDFMLNSYILCRIDCWKNSLSESNQNSCSITYQKELAIFNQLSEYGQKQFLEKQNQ